MSVENIVKFPEELDLLARDAQSGIAMINTAETDTERARLQRIEGALKASAALYNARQRFKADDEFGRWCHANNLGDNVVTKDDRGAFIDFGSDLSRARNLLISTKRTSWREIRRLEWGGSQPAKPPSPPFTTPKRAAAAATIRAYAAVHGATPTVMQAVKASGLSRIVIEPALATVKAEDKINPPSLPTKADNARHEAILKIRLQELEKTFDARVIVENKKQIDILFPKLEALQKEAASKEKLYREALNKLAVFTKAEYLDVLFCVRNEHVPQDRRDRATIALEAKKIRLVRDD